MCNRHQILLLVLIFSTLVVADNNITFAFTSNYFSRLEPIEENDTILGGAARLSSAIRNLRLTSDRFILMDTGNHFAGRFYREYRGEPEIELMNKFRYDAMAIGETELSMDEDILDNWARLARFQLLLSNAIVPPQCKICRHTVSYTVIDRVGLTVGVFALLPPELKLSGRIPDWVEIDKEYIFVAREMVSILTEKCDIVVVLSQLDIERNIQLANEVCEIDLIITSSWAGYEDEPIVIKSESGCITILGCGETRGTKLGVLKTTWDDLGNLLDFNWGPIKLDNSIALDPEIHATVKSYFGHDSKIRAIGRSSVELDGRDFVLRGAESNLGNLVADAMLDNFPNADIALFPGGSIWSDRIIEPGNITNLDIQELLPYDEDAVVVEVDGKTLNLILEHSVSNIDKSFGGFFQLSGAIVEFDTSRTPQEFGASLGEIISNGSRVRKLIIGGEELNERKSYRVVTTDFIASGGYDYFWLEELEIVPGKELTQVVIDYIRINSPITVQFEDRIVIEP